ncbi:hypothetical protein EDC56_1261 [Sinobacterium caligoides]|uniref:Gp37 protein n=1 Tax=Sinobacterium caligoides TaxID=933926 RepID=A0A3N2E1B1_9GAMM|nr:hypothetical protein [Sinobacterium caligoides]ROS05712.1 hypothetical protein EDC56_1261 [Sinobacterium caligoides]
MKTHISIDEYHDAIIGSIERDFSHYQTVTDYPTIDRRTQLKVPAAFVQVTDVTPTDSRGEGLIEWTIKTTIFIAIADEMSAKENQRISRQMAVDMANYCHSNSFGLPIQGSRVIDCSGGGFVTELSDLIVYEVQLEHDAQLATSNLYPDLDITDVWLGCAPNIGPDYKKDYDQVVKDGEPL